MMLAEIGKLNIIKEPNKCKEKHTFMKLHVKLQKRSLWCWRKREDKKM